MHRTPTFEGLTLMPWIDRNGVRYVPLAATTKLGQPRDLHGHKRAKADGLEIHRGAIRYRLALHRGEFQPSHSLKRLVRYPRGRR